MKQETIGSRGTVPGYRPLIGDERWLFDHYTKRHIANGTRPLLYGENGTTCGMLYPVTLKPLPPPAVETFEAHGHIWYKHTPGDECPVDSDVSIYALYEREVNGVPYWKGSLREASTWHWTDTSNGNTGIIGYRFPDYPAVNTTLQQEQLSVQQPTETIPTQFSTEQRLTSLYNDWCFLPPETVAECIADVASVLYPTDAERCEAAFQRWWNDPDGVDSEPNVIWSAAWKAAKESK